MWVKAEKFLSKDKYIGPLLKKYGACKIRPIAKKYYFKELVDGIVQQQLSLKAASTIFARITKELGGKVTPERVLRKKDESLRACGLSYSKIKYIKDLSARVKKGKLKLNKMDKLSDEEVMEEIIAVKGIGRWTAEMFLMFTLARPDIFPVDDLGIRKGVRLLGPSFAAPFAEVDSATEAEKATEGQVVKFAERWKPYRTVASWYIWRSLDG